jgi:hypothetical protein
VTSPTPPSEHSPDSEPGPGGQPPELVSQRVRTAIALTITAVWAVGIVADGLSDKFQLSPLVHAAMLGLAASIFGSNFVKGMRGGGS